MRLHGLRLVAVVTLAAAASPGPQALTDEEIFRELRINRINPGARSLALGGAFVSLADDATAAQANPAGSSFLRVPEYFVELRSVDNGGRSEVRSRTLPGNVAGFSGTSSAPDDVLSPSFLSAVTVYKRWAMGISVQDVVNVSDTTTSTFAFTSSAPETFVALQEGSIDLDVVNLNVSAGVRITDRLAVGGTLSLSQLDVRATVSNFLVETSGTLTGTPVVEPTLDLRTAIDDDGRDVVVGLGLLYKREHWHFGATYRRGPDFEVRETIVSAADNDGDGQPDGLDFQNVAGRLGTRFANRFHLPDVLSVGLSWQPGEKTTLAVDVERVKHSNLADGFIAGVNVLTDEEWRFDVADGTDFHVGFERILFNMDNKLPPMALRFGAFSESANTIEARATGAGAVAPRDTFGGVGRQGHASAGVFFYLGRYKLDLAADFSDTDNEYVVSMIFQGKGAGK